MSEKLEVHELIYKYIVDYDPKGEEIMKNIFGKILKKSEFLSLKTSSDYFEDLYSEFYKEKILQKRQIYIDKFRKNKKGLIAFLQKVIYNFLQDYRDKRKIEELKAIYDNNKEEKNIVDLIEDKSNMDIIKIIEAKEILNYINEFFNDEDKKILCYIFFKDKLEKDYCVKDLKPNTVYKRVERLKKDKLPKFIAKYGITFEVFFIFKEKIMMSAICKKICL